MILYKIKRRIIKVVYATRRTILDFNFFEATDRLAPVLVILTLGAALTLFNIDWTSYIGVTRDSTSQIGVLLSTLLVILYYMQYDTQKKQQNILDVQTQILSEQVDPTLYIKDIDTLGGQLRMDIQNTGEGPALNCRVFVHNGYYSKQGDLGAPLEKPVEGSRKVDAIFPSEKPEVYHSHLEFRSFDGSETIYETYNKVLDGDQLYVCLKYTKPTGETVFANLFSATGDLAKHDNFGSFFDNKELRNETIDRSDIIITRLEILN